jgi:hypothetical protein
VTRLAFALALALAAAPAAAASPRWGSLDIGAQSYRPDIDSEFAVSPGPYETVFGGRRGWMFQLGISRALYTAVGSLELGLRTGYFQDRGRGLVARDGVTEPSGEDTTLRIVPTSVVLTYRFDWPVERHGIPLAPYARLALERYNWWVTDGRGRSRQEGATNGWSVTGGLALLLDFFDRALARELDRESGINHTYLYVELTRSDIDDFGSSRSWDLSDERFSIGAGLMFVF